MGGGCGWGWWSKGILEFRFGPSLELRLEAGTKLNNIPKKLEALKRFLKKVIMTHPCHQATTTKAVLTGLVTK